eukprot:NODE_280_length_11906_cov_0.405268.p8 type:complete len:293 gc:universal NODE_280_length_11906_cov_0.405268:8500-9378(+)
MSKSIGIPIRDTWNDTILECVSIVAMFFFGLFDVIVGCTGLVYAANILQLIFKPKRVLDVTETSKSDLVYCSWLICCHGVSNLSINQISVEDLDVYIVNHNSKTFVCFFSNNPFFLLDLRKVQADNGFIRRGLTHYIKQFYIIKQRLPIDENPIVFTGHGAGGSVATLFSWFYEKPSHVIVFGAYPFGDFLFCEKFTCDLVERDIIIQRYLSEKDIFARFPSCSNPDASPESFMNYDFPGTSITIAEDSNIVFSSKYIPTSISHSLPRYYYFAIKNTEEMQLPLQSLLYTQD